MRAEGQPTASWRNATVIGAIQKSVNGRYRRNLLSPHLKKTQLNSVFHADDWQVAGECDDGSVES